MSAEVEKYIRANRDRYTRQAITEQLIAAGHERDAVEAAWLLDDEEARRQRAERGWRLGWREFLALTILGAIGAAFVWAGQSYGAGAIAPVVYVILVSVAFGVGKGLSIAVDSGHPVGVAIFLAVAGAVGAVAAATSNAPQLAVAAGLLAGVPALLILFLRGPDPRRMAMVAAFIPILLWLAVTGTCYSPLFLSGGGS